MKTLILLLCLLPQLASAAGLYRCVSKTGHVSYQSANCPPHQRMDRVIEYVADPVSSPPNAGSMYRAKQFAVKARGRSHQVSGSRPTRQPHACAHAKARRELQLQRLGLKRTYDDLSKIDAATRDVSDSITALPTKTNKNSYLEI